MIIEFFMLYIALMVVTIIHELGHISRKIVFKKFYGVPLPLASAMQAKSRYGGLIATATIFLLVYLVHPLNILLQLIGAVAFLHFILYCFFGSFNHEPKIPKKLWKYIVFDDIPNSKAWFFIPLSIFTFLVLKDYYIPIIIRFLGGS